MNIIHTLRRLIDFFFFGLVGIAAIIASMLILGVLPLQESFLDIPLGSNYNDSSIVYVVVVLSIIGMILFLAVIYHLRKVVMRFYENDLFHKEVLRSMHLIGLYLVGYAIIKNIVAALRLYIIESKVTFFSLNFKGFDSFWFLLIMGLFFIYMGKVLTRGSQLQKESDLTI